MKELSTKQIDFANTYLMNGESAEGACKEVGYSHSAGCKLLENRKIQAYLIEARNSIQQDGLATLRWKKAKLTQIVELSVPDWATMWNEIDAKSAIAAISELNKMEGDLAPTKNLNLNANISATIEQLTETRRKYKEY